MKYSEYAICRIIPSGVPEICRSISEVHESFMLEIWNTVREEAKINIRLISMLDDMVSVQLWQPNNKIHVVEICAADPDCLQRLIEIINNA